jgi:hypothetical protein
MDTMTRTLLTLTTLAVLTLLATVTGLLVTSPATSPSAPAPVVAPAVSPVALVSPPAASTLLRTWDARRAAAWARGDPHLLAALYTPSSPAGARDVSMLRAWRSRGLRVTGLTTQLLSVSELARSATRWRLRVTDRLTGGVALGPGVRRALPHDAPSTRVVVLTRASPSAPWLVASVHTVGPDPT